MNMAVKPSLRFALLLLLLHITAAGVVYMTAMPLGYRLAAILLILLSLIYYLLRDVLLLSAGSWREISLNQDGISLITRNGSKLFGQVTNKTVVSPLLVVLRVRTEGRQLLVSRVIFPDALGADAFREFCVRLKFL